MKAKLHGTYMFRDKDPAIDYLRTPFEENPETTNKIATIAGCSHGTVSNIFYGGTRNPQFATIVRIARAIGPQGEEALIRCVRTGGRGLTLVKGERKASDTAPAKKRASA